MTNTTLISGIVFVVLVCSVVLGRWLRRILPEQHLSEETKETVKLSIGLVATMAALVLGLLVSSARDSYDASRTQVIQMAAKLTLLDRVLVLYGPDAAEARAAVRGAVEESVQRIWPASESREAEFSVKPAVGNTAYAQVLRLEPGDDKARQVLKGQAVEIMAQLGEMRTLLEAQSASSLSRPLLVVMVCWLAIIFLGFTLLAPANATATAALGIALLSCCASISLILELNRPFSGHIRVSSQPMLHALEQMKQASP
jgi:Protein of unknown function (DUF4239)